MMRCSAHACRARCSCSRRISPGCPPSRRGAGEPARRRGFRRRQRPGRGAACAARGVGRSTNAARRLEIADRVERLCHDASLEDHLAWPLGWRIDYYFQVGQRPALDNAIARLEEYADRRHDALATWRGTMARAALAQHEGRFDDGHADRDGCARDGRARQPSGGRLHLSDPRQLLPPQDQRRAGGTGVRVHPQRSRCLPRVSGDAGSRGWRPRDRGSAVRPRTAL